MATARAPPASSSSELWSRRLSRGAPLTPLPLPRLGPRGLARAAVSAAGAPVGLGRWPRGLPLGVGLRLAGVAGVARGRQLAAPGPAEERGPAARGPRRRRLPARLGGADALRVAVGEVL